MEQCRSGSFATIFKCLKLLLQTVMDQHKHHGNVQPSQMSERRRSFQTTRIENFLYFIENPAICWK